MTGEMRSPSAASAAALAEPRVVFQPVIDLREGTVIGFEALARGPAGSPLESAAALIGAARAEGRLAELDHAARRVALGHFGARGLSGPLALFFNADEATLDGIEAVPPASGMTLVVDVSERAIAARPEAVLRSLARLRQLGWGVALDDVCREPRALALMPLAYPDVIKLDLAPLAERPARELACTVAAVGAEAERRHAWVLAESIHDGADLARAHAFGADLGQGRLLGPPEPLPDQVTAPTRGLRLTASGGAPDGRTPWQQVTNWRRPALGTLEDARRAARVVGELAAGVQDAALLLATLPGFLGEGAELDVWAPLAQEVALAGILVERLPPAPGSGPLRISPLRPGDTLAGAWTVLALAPAAAACFVATPHGADQWLYATTYDRDLVVECAVQVIGGMEPAG
jgi:EAL domain-containing protein (putative c-di-GMP-specific phosphodiesterase class I)